MQIITTGSKFAIVTSLLVCAGFIPADAREASGPGQKLFQANCTLCHGDDGKGKTPSGTALGAHDLTSPAVQKKSDSDLAKTISQGKDKMPSFEKKLSPSDIQQVISYVRTLGR